MNGKLRISIASPPNREKLVAKIDFVVSIMITP